MQLTERLTPLVPQDAPKFLGLPIDIQYTILGYYVSSPQEFASIARVCKAFNELLHKKLASGPSIFARPVFAVYQDNSTILQYLFNEYKLELPLHPLKSDSPTYNPKEEILRSAHILSILPSFQITTDKIVPKTKLFEQFESLFKQDIEHYNSQPTLTQTFSTFTKIPNLTGAGVLEFWLGTLQINESPSEHVLSLINNPNPDLIFDPISLKYADILASLEMCCTHSGDFILDRVSSIVNDKENFDSPLSLPNLRSAHYIFTEYLLNGIPHFEDLLPLIALFFQNLTATSFSNLYESYPARLASLVNLLFNIYCSKRFEIITISGTVHKNFKQSLKNLQNLCNDHNIHNCDDHLTKMLIQQFSENSKPKKPKKNHSLIEIDPYENRASPPPIHCARRVKILLFVSGALFITSLIVFGLIMIIMKSQATER